MKVLSDVASVDLVMLKDVQPAQKQRNRGLAFVKFSSHAAVHLFAGLPRAAQRRAVVVQSNRYRNIANNAPSRASRSVARMSARNSNALMLKRMLEVPTQTWLLDDELACVYCGVFRFARETTGFCCASGKIELRNLKRKLQNELMRKSMHVGSLAFAIEGEVKEKSKWFSTLRDLTWKLKILKMDHISLSEEA